MFLDLYKKNRSVSTPRRRKMGDAVTLQVKRRVLDLYKTQTIAEVYEQIAIEFPKGNYPLSRIRTLILDEKVRLANEYINSMIEGSYQDAEAIRAKLRDDLMDKRSRLKRSVDQIIDEKLKDVFGEP